MRAERKRRIVLAGIVLALAACAMPAYGASGTKITLPVGPKPSAKGLRLTVDCQWAQGYGYRPVVVEVACVSPSSADRTLTVDLAMASWSPDQKFVTATADIEIPAGSASVSKIIPVPQLTQPQHLAVAVWEDGRLIEDLSLKSQSIGGGYWGWDTEQVRMLFVGDSPPDISQLEFLAHNPYSQSPSIQHPSDVATFDHRTPGQLMENWINYSSLDVVFISLGDLKQTVARRPAVWRALRAWTRSGGNLCVFGAGDDWHALAELEQLLSCPADEKEAADKYRGWEKAENQVFENRVIPAAESYAVSLASAGGGTPQTTRSVKPPAAPQKPPFVWKPAAFGLVVAIADDNPFPGDSLTWRWLLESIGPGRTQWQTRYGTAPDGENPQFNDFLIADVGLPPIRTYRVLITLFVVGIGPVNYWMLRRLGRLHLFLFTVPAAALVMSGALLGYALVSDGLESRLRSRSLTYLDQQTGDAVSHARLSYYTGLAPSGGLAFSEQTAVVPLEQAPSTGMLSTRSRQLVWDEGQHLVRGWLGSRMPTQYVTVRARKSKQKLEFVPAGNPGQLAVRNHLGVKIEQLLYCEAPDKLHLCHEVADGGQAGLELLPLLPGATGPMVEFSLALSHHPPAYPVTMSAFDSHGNWFFPTRHRPYWYGQQVSVDSASSRLESELARIKSEVLSLSLPPGTYVAIVERPPGVEAGTDGLTESQSLHVIYGRL